MVVAMPPPRGLALGKEEFESALRKAEAESLQQKVTGKALTPFLLARLAKHTNQRTLRVNEALVLANARLAAQIAVAYESSAP